MKHPKVEIFISGDGSQSLYLPDLDETYHSRKGALAESEYVFVDKGLRFLADTEKDIRILEIGFGTGLNALLSVQFAINNPETNIFYHTLEPFPLSPETIAAIDYGHSEEFDLLHKAKWESEVELRSGFNLHKTTSKLEEATLRSDYNLVYFDAFAPSKQPEIWSLENLKKVYDHCCKRAVLVTYCSQGQFRRNLETAGFTVDRMPGPPGKREMIRAVK